MLSINKLNAWYGESHVLHGVDIEVRRGELVTILGRNGAGRPPRCAPSWAFWTSAAARSA